MEDPSVEWKIEEYSSSEYWHGKGSWFLNRGLGLGKKIVITGIAISSAPLVLPPLVVISALGLAFSVPLGVIFASYACTEKVMSKLLPWPTPALMLEDGAVSTNEEEADGETMGFVVDFDMRKVAVEQKDETKGTEEFQREILPQDEEYYVQQGVEKDEPEPMDDFDGSVKEGYKEDVGEYLDSEEKEPLTNEEEEDAETMGFVGDFDMRKVVVEQKDDTEGTEEFQAEILPEDEEYYVQQGVEKDEPEPMDNFDGSVKEGYEEDVGEYLDGEEKEPLEGVVVKIEGMGEEGEGEPLIEESGKGSLMEESKHERPLDVCQVVVTVDGDEKNDSRDEEAPIETEEQEELVKETTGLLEQFRDGDNVDSTVKDDELPGVTEEREQKNVGHVEEMEKLREDKKMRLEKLSDEVTGKQEDGGNEAVPKYIEMGGMRNEVNVDIVPKEVKLVGRVEDIREANRNGKNVDKSLEVKKSIAELNGRRLGGVMERVEEEQEPVVDEKAVMQGTRAKDYIAPEVHKGLQFTREKENVIHSNEDLREIAVGSGLDLFNDSNEAGDQYSYVVYENPEESENASDIAVEGKTDFLKPPASAALSESKCAGIISGKDTEIPSSEVLLKEEKIWEQIDALRTIVGYKATPHPTCIEELKALYFFTGVEPPAVFRVPFDLVEVNNKLRFLMSMVGVK